MRINSIVWLVIKKTFFYSTIGIPFAFVAAFLRVSELHLISEIIIYSHIFFVLFHIGWSIKRKSARKKYIIYMSIVISQMILLSVLGEIFGFKTYISSETENTLLDAISVFIMFGTILGILIKIVHDSKKEFPDVQWLCLPIITIAIALIIIATVFRFILFVLIASIVISLGIITIKKYRKQKAKTPNPS